MYFSAVKSQNKFNFNGMHGMDIEPVENFLAMLHLAL